MGWFSAHWLAGENIAFVGIVLQQRRYHASLRDVDSGNFIEEAKLLVHSIIEKVPIVSKDEFQSLKSKTVGTIQIIVQAGQPIGIADQEGDLSTPLLVVQITKDEDFFNIFAAAQVQLVKYPFVPGMIVVNAVYEIEGVIYREKIADKKNALLERDSVHELAGSPQNVPLVIYQCPKGDYEFIPSDGEPDHLCPVHNLQLEAKRIIANV